MDRTRPILVTTEHAALYILMQRRPHETVALFTQDAIRTTKTWLYNAARDGKLTRHGGSGWGEARWDLVEVHRVLHAPDS